ncbi:MAG: tripartite tricarboxylate transporter substrate-binding protein, partial [Pollutimonas bauzanensis]
MVVGFGPGGGNDILARILSRELGNILGQPVVVENRPGAGGIIGADNVAKAQPSGYSLYLGSTGTNTIAPALYAKMPFDPRKDLAPVAVIARAGNLVMVNNDLPVKNIGELIALAKKKPGTLNFGSSGNGSTVHLAGALFAEQAGIDIVHVPYKGDAQALSDLIAGQVQIGFSGTPPGLPFAKSGQARVLAVTTPNRSAALPDVPTVAEAGLPEYSFSTWYG